MGRIKSLAYKGNLTIKNFYTPKGKELFIDDYKIEDEIASFTMDLYGLIRSS
jgi:hypothetical protein